MTYTPQMTKRIQSQYLQEPTRETVDRLCLQIGKSRNSIIAKLSSAGIYVKPQRTSKSGQIIVRKQDLVKDIGQWFGLDLQTLAKGGKLQLVALHKALSDPIQVRAHLIDLQYQEPRGEASQQS